MSCTSEINKFKKMLMNAFDMTGLGNMVYFLGMTLLHSDKGTSMHQLKYELEMLKRFELMNRKSTFTPDVTNHKLNSDVDGEDVEATTFRQLVGSLRYLCNTRTNICYVVEMISMSMNKTKWSHYQTTVGILRYVKGTLEYGNLFPSGVLDDDELICYSDSDWCKDIVDRRNTT